MRRIVSDPAVMGGTPVVEGTEVTVEQILGLHGQGLTVDEICAARPALTRDDVRLVLLSATLLDDGEASELAGFGDLDL